MKLIKTLIATTFALTAATTFAASAHDKSHSTKTTEEKVGYQIKSNLKL